MSVQKYLQEFLDVTIQSISQHVESKNILPRPQMAFLKDSKVHCERIKIDSDVSIDLKTQRISMYWKKNKPDAPICINSGKIGQQGHYEFFDQYRIGSGFDNHKGDFAVQLAPIAPQFEKFA